MFSRNLIHCYLNRLLSSINMCCDFFFNIYGLVCVSLGSPPSTINNIGSNSFYRREWYTQRGCEGAC